MRAGRRFGIRRCDQSALAESPHPQASPHPQHEQLSQPHGSHEQHAHPALGEAEACGLAGPKAMVTAASDIAQAAHAATRTFFDMMVIS